VDPLLASANAYVVLGAKLIFVRSSGMSTVPAETPFTEASCVPSAGALLQLIEVSAQPLSTR
jgi:hypothetical protein